MLEVRCSTYKLTASTALHAHNSELTAYPVCTGHADNSLLSAQNARPLKSSRFLVLSNAE